MTFRASDFAMLGAETAYTVHGKSFVKHASFLATSIQARIIAAFEEENDNDYEASY